MASDTVAEIEWPLRSCEKNGQHACFVFVRSRIATARKVRLTLPPLHRHNERAKFRVYHGEAESLRRHVFLHHLSPLLVLWALLLYVAQFRSTALLPRVRFAPVRLRLQVLVLVPPLWPRVDAPSVARVPLPNRSSRLPRLGVRPRPRALVVVLQ